LNYDKILCRRISQVPPSGIRKFFDIVNVMDDVISLGVGEPDFKTPWDYTDAAIYSMRSGHTHYSSNWGLLELRKAISKYEAARFGPEYNPENEILVTVGASEGIDLAIRALVEPGDEVLIPDPSYVSYMPCVTFAGGVCVPVKTDMEHDFKLLPEVLKAAITPKTKALILPYPNNPTGGIMTEKDYIAIAEVLKDTDIIVIHDEIYAELNYSGMPHVSFAAIPGMWDRTITLNGFSKAFAMTGWRLGYACGPKELMAIMCRIHQYTMLCAPISSQYAGIEAIRAGFDTDFSDVRRMVSAYDRRRRMLVNGFREMGLSCHEPLGAFYVFPSVTSLGLSSEDFCEKLLYGHRVAAVPGTAFGSLGEGHIRCSAASSNENIQTAITRMQAFVDSLK